MTLDEAYRHIKASYIHHSQERNAVFLPQAELIAMECIEKCKQADVQSVKHGKWIYVGSVRSWDEIKCSACNSAFSTEDRDLILNWDFCPHCGARMEGDTE